MLNDKDPVEREKIDRAIIEQAGELIAGAMSLSR